ncbi:hypothetical protein [Phenylobacterium sp.]|jgi:hypothetical protein|uniref:hypothetical protein n=1 Tax=Phenylobacterium sp. TaxID=1871053 RepID=UPI0008CE8793|nr:hypothetical protein [Phenylobacterium sp.]MBA4795681.1 hypothetical protein [Phenylobacterium sp.]MBC7168546.1 hypothetical protein [Phenylobacterium sp.]OHB36683.1 MAG: hypothetical protein A2882_07290 [Phenylobacterium sp. RIFCSPHIGHO2_01_FULL_70_10]
MRSGLVALAAGALLASGAQAQTLSLHKPADLNKDGVVTAAEQAEYEASKGKAKPWDEPSPFSVSAPPSSGPNVTFNQGPADYTTQPRLADRAVEASGFEEYINAEAEKKRADR